jgi:hypothetical protein
VIFYLTAPDYTALERTDAPLFVNHFALFGGRAKRLPRARGPWCLDSGGYTQLKKKANKGRWPFSPEQYVHDVRRCVREIGGLQWAAIMDFMTEDEVLAATGLDVREHQYRTIDSYLALRRLGGPELENVWLPVLQGRCPEDYQAHYAMYLNEGIALEQVNWVGVGSVCRLGNESRIAEVFGMLSSMGLYRLHAFGLKRTGLTWEDVGTCPRDPGGLRLAELYRKARERGVAYDEIEERFQLQNTTWEQVATQVCNLIYSADSNAWSYRAREHANDVRRARDETFGDWAEIGGVIHEWTGPAPGKAGRSKGKGVGSGSAAAAAQPFLGRVIGQVDVSRLGTIHPLAPTQMREDCATGRIERAPGFMHEACNQHLEWALDWREGLRTLLEPIGCWDETPYYRTLPASPFAHPVARAAQTIERLTELGLWPPGQTPLPRALLPPPTFGAQRELFNPGRARSWQVS